jgi:hypothetical protein
MRDIAESSPRRQHSGDDRLRRMRTHRSRALLTRRNSLDDCNSAGHQHLPHAQPHEEECGAFLLELIERKWGI